MQQNRMIKGLWMVSWLLCSAPLLAQDMSAWSDKTICRLLQNQADNSAYRQEAEARGLSCGLAQSQTQSAKQAGAILTKGDGLRIYEVRFKQQDQQRLMSEAINKTAFDFSAYAMAQLDQPLSCAFNMRRVVYEHSVQGDVESWNMALGNIVFTAEGARIDGRWRMGGLSKDPFYLDNEVNLGLTADGHLVGKMAYFNLKVDGGEVARSPLYVELVPHKRSQPMDLQDPHRAEFWMDVEDWAGAVWYLYACR